MHRFLWASALLLLFPLHSHAHSQYKARYVAENGVDQGRCDSPLRPCKTIAYAARHAVKGERIVVSSGNYRIEDVQDLFYLTSGTIQVLGGYNRYEHFQKQAPEKNPTRLLGVPSEYRAQVEAKGFQIIADRKSVSRETKKALDQFVTQRKQLQSNKSAAPCVGGQSGIFSCDGLDLLSQVSIAALGASGPNQAVNDVWGFVDLNNGREYAFVGFNVGTAVLDVTDPENPRIVERLDGRNTIWRDIKVYQFFDSQELRWKAYAYVTADAVSDRVKILDLTDLPNGVVLANSATPELNAHNVYISNVDYATGLPLSGEQPIMYTAGGNLSGGAFRGYNLSDPIGPQLVQGASTGYTHDATSLVIDDVRKDTQCANATTSATCNVLVDYNESSFKLWDVTDAGSPVLLSDRSYSQVNYVHSGWWSEDKQFIFVHDELDESNANLFTTLRIFDVSDLLNPVLAGTWRGVTRAIDHNGFVKGNRYYMSNYERGITVLDITDPTNPSRVGFFDTYPPSNVTAFNGAWGAYPYLDSGNVLVSDDIGGLFILADNTKGVSQGQLGFALDVAGVSEGDTATITVTRTGGAAGAVSVDYSTLDGSTDPFDYQPAQGTLTWALGDNTSRTINIPINADAIGEDIERLLLRLSNPQGGATLGDSTASIFVSDLGGAPTVQMLDSSVSAGEFDGSVFITVKRTGSAQGAVTVGYQTISGTATAATDFVAANGTLSWADGDASGRTIAVDLLTDSTQEGNETFTVELVAPVGANVAAASATVTLSDTTQSPAPPAPGSGSTSGGGTPDLILLLLLYAGLLRYQFGYPKSSYRS